MARDFKSFIAQSNSFVDSILSEFGLIADAGELPYRIKVFCLTDFETVRGYAELGDRLFASRYNIGWWPWELPVWPSRWSRAFDVIDEVWAATRFTEAMFRKATTPPVTLIPMAVSVERMRKLPRKTLGLPARRFVFLFVFDFNSYLARKNTMAAVDAFQRTFPLGDAAKVGLVLKTMNSKAGHPNCQAFVERCAADPRIVLLQQTLAHEEVLGLIDACDAYLSLHRSEGIGRTLVEAMLRGKPVIATDCSGNAGFLTTSTGYPVKWTPRAVEECDYPFISAADGATWADVDLDEAAQQLRGVFERPLRRSRAPARLGARFVASPNGSELARRLWAVKVTADVEL